MKVTRKEVEHVALLSRLEFAEPELVKMTEQLNAILEYVAVLERADTSGIEPLAHVLDIKNVSRPDVVVPSLPREEALSNAPEQENGCFRVPRIIE